MRLNGLQYSDRACVARLIVEILAPQELKRFAITINDGEEDVIVNSKNMLPVLDAMGATDEEYVTVNEQYSDGEWHTIGTFHLIYSNGSENDPMVCISNFFSSSETLSIMDEIYGRVEAFFEKEVA